MRTVWTQQVSNALSYLQSHDFHVQNTESLLSASQCTIDHNDNEGVTCTLSSWGSRPSMKLHFFCRKNVQMGHCVLEFWFMACLEVCARRLSHTVTCDYVTGPANASPLPWSQGNATKLGEREERITGLPILYRPAHRALSVPMLQMCAPSYDVV